MVIPESYLSQTRSMAFDLRTGVGTSLRWITEADDVSKEEVWDFFNETASFSLE